MIVGIDVAADRLNYVALSATATFVDGGVCHPSDLSRLGELAAEARVIAIDAPAQLSTEPHRHDGELNGEKFRGARCAEVALGRNYGIWVPWVGPSVRPTDGWIATGLALYEQLATSSKAELIEVFPHAAFRVLTQPARLASKKSAGGIRQRVEALSDAELGVEGLEMWSHDSLDAAVSAMVALDRLRGTAVAVGCGHDSSRIWLPGAAVDTTLVEPEWPTERFFLISIPEGWDLGLFEPERWVPAPDRSVYYEHDGHPIRLRVRKQDGKVLHANNGDVSDMSWRILPLSAAPGEWQERDRQADQYKSR